MASTFPSTVKPLDEEQPATTVLRWRNWPLVDYARGSWLALVGVLLVGGVVAYLGKSWLLAILAAAGLAATFWQFFVPMRYEIGSLGLRLTALGRTRFIPWHAIQAYQLRSSGVLLYPCPQPAKTDLLRSLFVPYPADEDDALCSIRQHLAHAAELPE